MTLDACTHSMTSLDEFLPRSTPNSRLTRAHHLSIVFYRTNLARRASQGGFAERQTDSAGLKRPARGMVSLKKGGETPPHQSRIGPKEQVISVKFWTRPL
jgi:hypothetical protein